MQTSTVRQQPVVLRQSLNDGSCLHTTVQHNIKILKTNLVQLFPFLVATSQSGLQAIPYSYSVNNQHIFFGILLSRIKFIVSC